MSKKSITKYTQGIYLNRKFVVYNVNRKDDNGAGEKIRYINDGSPSFY
ncbi:hypothetical protein J2TS6_46410 [Paenibacillus albilobatus]|uniref:Uncharacterized protein n=1 Tax=Paenibacillus albilobatus TaxID=2716884 RepID=A0A919XN83_9BACL|nr:hypothetical protein J2TS6_46410 [Paenibacillus albilobatus]